MKGLTGKRVLITGGANGIGKAITQRFVCEGCIVFVADIDANELARLDTDQIHPLVLDISNRKSVRHQLSRMELDILVNNAAITSGDDYERIMAVNCNGTRYVTETVLAGMKKRKKGNIIFITSVHTAMAFPGDCSYDASKHWAVGYMRARALELAPLGIRVNAVAPGAIDNAGTQVGVKNRIKDYLGKKIPLRRMGDPREIASAVAFLASGEANYITGAEFRVDGGLSIKNPLID